jgi:hypothetical protein
MKQHNGMGENISDVKKTTAVKRRKLLLSKRKMAIEGQKV